MPKHASLADLETLEGWANLTQQEQSALKAEDRGIQDDLSHIGQSRLSLGKRLKVWNDILTPKGLFLKFLKLRFHMTKQTAYNYMNLYESAAKDAPKPVLDIAMQRNYAIKPGIFKKNPPPKTSDTGKIIEYLDGLQRIRSRKKDVFPSQDELLKKTLHGFTTSYKLVPNRSKPNWLESFIGMALTRAGVTHKMTFEPSAVPEHLIVVRGRPREKAA